MTRCEKTKKRAVFRCPCSRASFAAGRFTRFRASQTKQMTRRFFRFHELVAVTLGVLFVVSCSSSGAGTGCGCMEPLPSGRYVGPKVDDAVNLRLSPAGINYLNNNWQQLVQMFAPGGALQIPVACMKTNVAVLGDVTIADQGAANGNGKLDGNCTAADLPANVTVNITGFQLVPKAPNIIEGSLSISVDTGKIYARTTTGNSVLCLGLSKPECSVRFNTAKAAGVTNKITAQVKFAIDTKWDKWLSFEVLKPLKGVGICGTQPDCLDPNDIDISGENTCGNLLCGLADWAPLKNLLFDLVAPLLQTQIDKAVAAQSCEACGTGKPACPQYPNGTPVAASTCEAATSTCKDSATSKCVPRFLGVEGRVNLGTGPLANFGVPSSAMLDLSVGAGSSVSVDQGINIGTRAGLTAVTVAPCVPMQAAPPMVAIPAPQLDAEADPTKGAYHAGVAISSQFMNLSFHQAHQAGALCLQMSSATVGLLNSGLFKTFLPSLGKLATRDGKDAPMMIALRPGKAPVVDIGKGTFDPVTKKPIEPLLLVKLPDVTVDFYAMIDERFARLFSLTADISLPVSLIFTGCDSVTPAIGDLKMLIGNIRTANSEMLAEDPKVLADLIPAVIGLAEPAVASALKPFALPALGQFKLKVNEVKGIGNVSGTKLYNHLALYAELKMPINCAVSSPKTVASLKRSEIPPAKAMLATGQGLPLPRAILDVHALGKTGTPEFAFRVDEGSWSTFFPAPNGELVVEHPVFLLQGQHRIEVRSRVEEDPHGVSAPVQVGFMVDFDAPVVKLTADRAHDLIAISAHDVITPDDKLAYAFAIGEGAFTDFGVARDIGLTAVEARGGVTVRVRDQAGNIGEAKWLAPVTALRPDDATQAVPGETQASGCSAGLGGLSVAGLALLALIRRRRQN